MYVTIVQGSKSYKVATMRVYTNEAELANFLRRCRRDEIAHIQLKLDNIRNLLLSNPNYQNARLYTERNLEILLRSTLEEFINHRGQPTIFYCEDNPADADTKVRRNIKLTRQRLIERFRDAGVRMDDRINDIPLPEDVRP